MDQKRKNIAPGQIYWIKLEDAWVEVRVITRHTRDGRIRLEIIQTGETVTVKSARRFRKEEPPCLTCV